MGFESLKSKMLTKPYEFTDRIEGPSCDKEGNIYAVNFKRLGTIGKVTPNGNSSVFIELPMGSVGSGTRINRNGTLFIADYKKHNIFAVNIETKEIRVFAHDSRMNQPNDLAITEKGVLFASDPNWSQSTGQIWRINKNGVKHLLETNMGTTNGIEVSPGDKKLYVNESVQRKIWVYDLSSNYELSNKRLLIDFPDFGLDGMRCDMAGNLFVTRYGKGVVAKISPDGHVLSEIHLTGKNCTNLTFGGPDGKTCYVTVADTGNIQMFKTDVPGRCWSLLHETERLHMLGHDEDAPGRKMNPVNLFDSSRIKYTRQLLHTIQYGETLSLIAQKYDTTISTIAKWNNLHPNSFLWVGQKLIIPYPRDLLDTSRIKFKRQLVHTVQYGETLWSVAQKYSTTISSIAKWNNLHPNSFLWVGQKLIIHL